MNLSSKRDMNWRIIALWAVGSLTPAAFTDTSTARQRAGNLFEGANASTFRVQIDAQGMANLKTNHRQYVRATVHADGITYWDVGLRLKGKSTFQPLDEKPNLTIKFDEFSPGQSFQGHKKILLNNSSQDPTFLHELLASSLFRDVGVPAARVTHARVELNDRDLGLYVLVEAVNKQFLARWFGDSSGNLYEGTTQDINTALEQDNGKDRSQADRQQLFRAALEDDPGTRLKKLRKSLDIDSFLRFIAMEMCLGQWDGYARNRNNYRIYHDPRKDLMIFLPHGLDLACHSGIGLRPPPGSLLVDRLYSVPGEHAQYWRHCSNIAHQVWQADVLTNRINAAVARMLPLMQNDAERRDITSSATKLCAFVSERHRELQRFLAGGEIKPLEFGSNNMARLTGWEPCIDQGKPRFQKLKENGKQLLLIEAARPETAGSWRTRVYLPQGRYVFRGRARLTEGASMTNAQVGLRIAGREPVHPPFVEDGWQDRVFEFEIFFGGQDMELICEMKADQGKVWFDCDSLQIERLNAYPPMWQPGEGQPIRAFQIKP